MANDARTLLTFPRETMQDKVVAELRRGLMIGAFVPGQPITLRKLADDLGTSPMPVREAINRLVAERALTMLHNRSVTVPPMTESRFMELTVVRQVLEGMAAELACEKAGPDLVPALSAANEDLRKAIAARDVGASVRANQSFHFTLYEASESQTLPPLIEMLWLQVGPFMFYSLSLPSVRWDASYHLDILSALATRNAAGVRQAIESDIAVTAEHLRAANVFELTPTGGRRLERVSG